MIIEKYGSLFDSKADAFVNPVNCVGVMGKGLAAEFKRMFPHDYELYRRACADGRLRIGSVFTAPNSASLVHVIHFPTKNDWRNPSLLEYVEKGLPALRDELIRLRVKSVAVPALGCGLGGLNWSDVKPLLISALGSLEDVRVELYSPL